MFTSSLYLLAKYLLAMVEKGLALAFFLVVAAVPAIGVPK
jgi:hypothetical protein